MNRTSVDPTSAVGRRPRPRRLGPDRTAQVGATPVAVDIRLASLPDA